MKRNQLSLLFVAGLLSVGSAFSQSAAPKAKGADGHDHSHGNAHGQGDAIGVPGQAEKVTRTVNVDMTDKMRFIPATLSVKQGETIRFVVKNSGQLKHEFVLGTKKELEEHYEVMKKHPEMEHADPNMVTLGAGKTGEVIWQFTRSGKVDFACLQPGHYDAGMKGAVTVAAVKGAGKSGHGDHKH
jgi:uncharacterized cupredoxin-like copper-binding protein